MDASSCLRNLDPFLCQEGLVRVGGRLGRSGLKFETRHPIIIPSKSQAAQKILLDLHLSQAHSGSEHILSVSREKYWIIHGRQTAKGICHSCISCRKRHSPLLGQKMADLPANRVEAGKPPFSYVGLDYFGPIYIKRARSTVKRYGCLFTCLTTRAIHIEIAHSLDTDSFIQALTRFISRRGNPEEIRSDNGTNFRGAEKELGEALAQWNQSKIGGFLVQKRIKWFFNPAFASHFGGSWERQIRTVRKVLGGLTSEQVLGEESLLTLMCQVENIVNSRPLTQVSSDPNDNEPLTPNHLLLLRHGTHLPIGVFCEKDQYVRKRWRQVQYLSDIFWKRWLKEYLVNLQLRSKWHLDQYDLKVNDLVLVMNENLPRNVWPMGRVTEVHKGTDGRVRSVTVKTVSSVLTRPIHKLCLLEGVKMQKDGKNEENHEKIAKTENVVKS